MKIMVINGPNLNLLGIREIGVYGNMSYDQMCDKLSDYVKKLGHTAVLLQSNSEGELIDYIHSAYFEKYDGIVINPGAYTHYSYALHDALKGVPVPAVEVHLSNIHEREEFRRISVTAPACVAQIYGHGYKGYEMAVDELLKK